MFDLFKNDKLRKVFYGAILAGIGCTVATFQDLLTGVDLGSYGAVVGAIASVVANAIRKYVSK